MKSIILRKTLFLSDSFVEFGPSSPLAVKKLAVIAALDKDGPRDIVGQKIEQK